MWASILALSLFFQNSAATQSPVRDGLSEYNRKNYARAVELLAPAMATLKPGAPAYTEAVLALGQSYFLLGQFSDAVPWLEKRVEARSRPEIEYMLSQACLQVGLVEKGRAVLAKLYNAAPESAAAHALTARMLVRLARNKEAIQQLERAIAIDPKQADTHLMLGELTLAAGQAETAAKHFREALQLDPTAPASWLGLGEAESRLERWTEAIPALQKSIWLNPHVAPPYAALGKAYLRVKSLTNAETMLRKALELDPKNATAANLLQQTLRQTNR